MMAINFTSSKDNDKVREMHSKSDNKQIMKNDKVVTKRFESLLSRYKTDLETTMKGSSFIFDHIHLLYYKCCKIKPNRVGHI